MRTRAGVGLVACLVVPLLLALTPAPADAAMALRITVDPSSPLVGRPARVTVLTLAPFSDHCVYEPGADMRPWSDWYPKGQLRFELKAFEGGRELAVPLRQRESDPVYWDGEIVFPAAGSWTLRMVHPEWSGGDPQGEACAGARITVPVRASTGLPDTSTGDLSTRAQPNVAVDERPPAAVCFDIVVDPDPAQVGRPTAVTVRTQWKSGVGELDLRVWAPERSSFDRAALTRASTDEEVWRGRLTFARAGKWALQAGIAVESNEYPCFYRSIDVVAAPLPTASTSDTSLPVLAIASMLAAITAALLMGLTRYAHVPLGRRDADPPSRTDAAIAPNSSTSTENVAAPMTEGSSSRRSRPARTTSLITSQ